MKKPSGLHPLSPTLPVALFPPSPSGIQLMESLAKIRNTVCTICTHSKHYVAGNKQNTRFKKDNTCSAQLQLNRRRSL